MKLFPLMQFAVEGFTFGSGLLAYVRENIPSKLIKTELSNRVFYKDKLPFNRRF